MPRKRSTQVPARRLVAIASELQTPDGIEWKEAIKDRVTQLGYPRPMSRDVCNAMDRIEQMQERQRKAAEPHPGDNPTHQEHHARVPLPTRLEELHPSVREHVLEALDKTIRRGKQVSRHCAHLVDE